MITKIDQRSLKMVFDGCNMQMKDVVVEVHAHLTSVIKIFKKSWYFMNRNIYLAEIKLSYTPVDSILIAVI
jgi:hypothetical protein